MKRGLLPPHLQAAINSVSVTVQRLVMEVALYASGMPPEPRQGVDEERTTRGLGQAPSREDLEKLHAYLYTRAPEVIVDQSAIGIAVLAGHSATQIAEFVGWEKRLVKNQMDWMMKSARKLKTQ